VGSITKRLWKVFILIPAEDSESLVRSVLPNTINVREKRRKGGLWKMEKSSGSGIRLVTEDGVMTLEELQDDEHAKEFEDTLHSDKYKLYRRPGDSIKSKGKGGRSVVTRFYNQNAINRENFGRLRIRTMDAQEINVAICSALSTGDKLTVRQVYDELKSKGMDIGLPAFQSKFSYVVTKTRVKYIIESGSISGTAAKYYTLKKPFRGLTTEEIVIIMYSRKIKKDEYESFCRNNVEIWKYLKIMEEKEEDDLKRSGKSVDKEEAEKEEERSLEEVSKSISANVEPDEKTVNSMNKVIEEVLKDKLGLDVNVNGKIEIVFKFGLN
jgi:hypothetical protein